VERMAIIEDRLVIDVEGQYHHRNVFSKWVDLAYNKKKETLEWGSYLGNI